MASKIKLLDQMREVLRLKHMSYHTEEAYVSWVKRFILFHDKRHPNDMGAEEIRAFLIHLAVRGKVTASTQNVGDRSRLTSAAGAARLLSGPPCHIESPRCLADPTQQTPTRQAPDRLLQWGKHVTPA